MSQYEPTAFFALIDRLLSNFTSEEPFPANLTKGVSLSDTQLLIAGLRQCMIDEETSTRLHRRLMASPGRRIGLEDHDRFPSEWVEAVATNGFDGVPLNALVALATSPNYLADFLEGMDGSSFLEHHMAVPQKNPSTRNPTRIGCQEPETNFGQELLSGVGLMPPVTVDATPSQATMSHSDFSPAIVSELPSLLRAVFENAIRTEFAKVPMKSRFTVGELVDTVILKTLGTAQLTTDAEGVVLDIVADVMRRVMRENAEDELNGNTAVSLHELLPGGSIALYAGGARGAIDRDEWWTKEHQTDPEFARFFAIYRFAGRTESQLARVLNLKLNKVQARIEVARQRIADSRLTGKRV